MYMMVNVFTDMSLLSIHYPKKQTYVHIHIIYIYVYICIYIYNMYNHIKNHARRDAEVTGASSPGSPFRFAGPARDSSSPPGASSSPSGIRPQKNRRQRGVTVGNSW